MDLPQHRLRRGQQHSRPVRGDRRPAGAAVAARDGVRIRVTPSGGQGPVFAGIAPAGAAGRYLAGVGYDTVRGITHYHPVYTGHGGGAPATAPAQAGIWAAHVAGPAPRR
ncbi:MAG TPA: hypothetical protein VGF54_06045 [Streptosporangiaceae bacterium]